MNQISSTLGINAEKMQNEMYLNDTTLPMNHEVFKNEILKMIFERENELISGITQNLPNQVQSNFEMMDSTSTQPIYSEFRFNYPKYFITRNCHRTNKYPYQNNRFHNKTYSTSTFVIRTRNRTRSTHSNN